MYALQAAATKAKMQAVQSVSLSETSAADLGGAAKVMKGNSTQQKQHTTRAYGFTRAFLGWVF